MGSVARGGACIFSLALACAQGGPGSPGASVSAGSLGEGSETTGGDTGTAGTDDDDTSSGDTSTSGIGGTGTTASPPSCDDSVHNGDETDVDCGGSCSPCSNGQACVDADDCGSGLCEGALCCTASTYERTTGDVSGMGMVCCDGDDTRLELTPCGTGVNYSVGEAGANCATTSEGAMNNGTACVAITCEALDCTEAGTGTT